MKAQWVLLIGCFLSFQGFAERKSLVDAEKFLEVSKEALQLRRTRVLDSNQFLAAMQEKGVLILDARTKANYDRKHLKGAINLNFSDFDEHKLKKAVASKETKILIYCNNNILGDQQNFATKVMVVALNHQTYIDLYAYGYKNVYELGALVDINDKRFVFEGTALKRKNARVK